jgi:lactoylglutathione lyase
VRTLHVGLRVDDLDASIAFYRHLGYEVVGRVPETDIGSLVMLKLPDDSFVTLELVHRPGDGPVTAGALNHLVVQVEDLPATLAGLERHGITAGPSRPPTGPIPSSSPGSPTRAATRSSSSSGRRGTAWA